MERPPTEHPAPAVVPLALPSRPPEATSPGFPWLAAVAPVAAAAVLWSVTGSVLSLAFAALGPLVAVASMLDARRQGRRARRRSAAERAIRLAELRASIDDRHDAERAAAWRRVVTARDIVDGPRPFDWSGGASVPIVLGRGAAASAVRVDGTPVDEEDRGVLELAARLDDVPVLAELGRGIGVVGTGPFAAALARALVVQVAYRRHPAQAGIAVPTSAAWAWTAALPHRDAPATLRVVDPSDGPAAPVDADPAAMATIAVVRSEDELPPGLETIVVVEGRRRATVERAGGGSGRRPVVPDLLGAAEAADWVGRVRSAAIRDGLGGSAIPDRVPFDTLDQPEAPVGSRATLRVAVGRTAGGAVHLDLVSQGPHAIVAGTTGSGKSEFLLAWLAALVRCHPPDRVAFLLVDFKGGASFEPIRGLPHVTGIVTDLDEAEADRAVQSLRAELRHRESVLLGEGVRDIAGLPDHVVLPRLVLVVDEFQAMVERFPELGSVVADVAARGRSLGVHLVLASQRPNGVVREQVSANCSIRVSLRVRQRADSLAVVGTEAAAAIRPDTPGRGVVDVGDGSPVSFQSAVIDPTVLQRLQRSSAGLAPARRPWVDPLPSRVPREALTGMAAVDVAEGDGEAPGASLPIGLVDEPERQRHALATWTPAADGHLLVVGEPGSGRSTALAATARAAAATRTVVRIDGPPGAQWDALCRASDLRRGSGRFLVLVDDLDVGFGDWPDDHRLAALRMVEGLLRQGRERSVDVAASARSAHRIPSGLRELFGTTILLRHPARSDLVQAGGAGALWRAGDPPGAGQWRDRRVQLVDAAPLPAVTAVRPTELRLDRTAISAIVSGTPRSDAAILAELGHRPVLLEPALDATARAALANAGSPEHPLVVVGDADAWTANWTFAAVVREAATIVVHGGAREYRVFADGSTPPPLLDDPVTQCWVRRPGSAPIRCAWPVHVDN